MSHVHDESGRRRFLATLGRIGAFGAAGLAPGCCLWLTPRPGARRLASLLHHPEAAGRLGRLALALSRSKRSAADFAAELVATMGFPTEHESDRELMARFDEAVRRDYALGRTELIDYWVLSRTEVQLCRVAGALEREELARTRRAAPAGSGRVGGAGNDR